MKFVEMTPGHWIRRSSVEEVRIIDEPVVEFGQRPAVQVKFKSRGPSVWQTFEFATPEEAIDHAAQILNDSYQVVLRLGNEELER